MPFFGEASSPEVNGGKFYDVGGDLNQYQHDDHSIQTSGRDNLVTQINRPAMISNDGGGHMTVNIYLNSQQDYLGNAYPLSMVPLTSNPGHPMFPNTHSGHPQQFTSPPSNYQSNVSNVNPYAARSVYTSALPPSPPKMPVPPPPFNILTPSLTAGTSPVQMPVPIPAPTLAGMEMPSASQDIDRSFLPMNPATPPYDHLLERTSNEPQPVFFRPAFRLSVPSARPGTYSSPSNDRLQGSAHFNPTMPPQRPIDPSFVPLPASPQQDGGPRRPAELRNLKCVPNTGPPSSSLSGNQPSKPRRDNAQTFCTRNIGQSLMAPEPQWITPSAWPSKQEFSGGHETGSFSESMPPPVEPSQSEEINMEGLSGFDMIPPKKLRRMREVIRGKRRS